MDTKKLRQKILDLAIHGKLVPQDPNDEPASVLLERIRAEKERLIKEGKIKRSRKTTKTSDDACDKQEVPFEVPSGWVWTIINEVGNIVTGGTPQKDIKEYYGGSIPFYKPNDLEQGINTLTAADHLSILGFEQSRKLPINSVLVTCIGATIGKTGRILKEGTCNQQINAVIHNQSINPLYLYYILVSEYFQHLIRSNASATTLPILNKSNFSKLRIPLPPLAEQQRIAAEIKRWFNLIDIIEQGKADLQITIKQAKNKILELAIHGKLVPQDPNDEPASELLKRINPKAEITCDNGHYYPKLPYSIPYNWVWVPHNNIINIIGGAQPPKSQFREYFSDGYIRLYQIRDYGESPLPVYIPIETATKQTKKGDILLARYGASLGKVFRAEAGAYNVAMAKASVKYFNLIDENYLYFFYLSNIYQEKILSISRTAQAGFNNGDFVTMFFPLPPLTEQRRIAENIEHLFIILKTIEENL
ncbi:MAG: restriction endonuclease subunit S [Prevotella sp.]|nr:restriction endonuclease subunit S [Prevotella sp.]